MFATYCARCHGANVVSGGQVPDLRCSAESTHKDFQDIVRGGALHEFGMASFADDLTAEQVKSIEGYVLSRAKESAMAEAKGKRLSAFCVPQSSWFCKLAEISGMNRASSVLARNRNRKPHPLKFVKGCGTRKD